MVPENRGEDERHEISKFNKIRYAVSAYKNNLNTHPFYEEFRIERAKQRSGRLSGSISGIKLIKTLRGILSTLKNLVRINSVLQF